MGLCIGIIKFVCRHKIPNYKKQKSLSVSLLISILSLTLITDPLGPHPLFTRSQQISLKCDQESVKN